MFETKFNAKEIPYKEFEKVGWSKEDVLKKIPKADLAALLTGRRTDFIKIDVNGTKLDVKISLHRNEDNSVSMRFHPINRIAPNIYNLTDEQQNDLKTKWTDSLVVNGVKENGEKAEMLVQYDPETNEYVSAIVEDIPVPEKINDVELDEKQKSDWKKGLYIDINDEPVRVSLTDVYGFAGKVFMFAFDGGISLAIAHLLADRTVEVGTKGMSSTDAANGQSNSVKSSNTAEQASVVTRDGKEARTANGQSDSINNSITPSPDQEVAKESKETRAVVNGSTEQTTNTPDTVSGRASSASESKVRSGVLVDHGPAPYQNKEGEKESYFVTLEKQGKETTIWGVGLADAVEKSGVERGDVISLTSEGRKEVTVPKEIKNDEGETVGMENINTHRNEWSISNSSRSVRR